jgi:hypothetical protein
VHKSAHSRDLLAEGHTKWPAITSTVNACLDDFVKIILLVLEREGLIVTIQNYTFLHNATNSKRVKTAISSRHQPVTSKPYSKWLFVGKSIWDLCWTKLQWESFSPSTPTSPVSVIPPILYTHSFIYYRRYTRLTVGSVVK